MNAKKWKPGGRPRNRAVSAKWNKKTVTDAQPEQPDSIVEVPLVPRKRKGA